MIPVLNSLGLDAMTAHWEFAYGPGTFKELAADLSFPMLAMNVFDKVTRSRRHYPTVFVTEQGVAQKYGRNRQQHTERSIGALKAHLARHRPLHAELRGTFVAV